MKKAFLFAIAFIFTSFMQAAAVDWSVALDGGLLESYTDSSIYTYAIVGGGSTPMSTVNDVVSSWAADKTYTDTTNGIWGGDTVKLNALGVTGGTVAGFDVNRSTYVDYLVVILAKDDGSYMWSYRDGTQAPYIETRGELEPANVENEVVFNNNSTWTEVPVPEPTALALLALGVAGLALRRKNA